MSGIHKKYTIQLHTKISSLFLLCHPANPFMQAETYFYKFPLRLGKQKTLSLYALI